MRKINILSKNIYNRIAAGEVIDRPYSAVKELVENSIDAGATEIEIHIENGGKSLIKVIDNGGGIYKDDLRSAFLPHATSKISSVDDLEIIQTLGFRGEALASISAIARVELTSRARGESEAYTITCDDNGIGQIKPAALDEGTIICVNDLFYNTPVRQRFLKTERKEESDITSFISRYILSHSEISFKYYADGKLVLQSFGSGIDEAMVQIYGAKTVSSCIKIDGKIDDIRVYGFIGNQNFFKANKTYQSIFINGRYVVNSTVQVAMSQAYSNYVMKRQYPFYVLFLEMPTDFVDVNVHPSKAEVRFVDSRQVFSAVYKIVSSVLDGMAGAADFVDQSTRIPQIDSTMRQDSFFVAGEPRDKTDESFTVPFVKLEDEKTEAKEPERKDMPFGITNDDIKNKDEFDKIFKYGNDPMFGPLENVIKDFGKPQAPSFKVTDENVLPNAMNSEAVELFKEKTAVQGRVEDNSFRFKGDMFNTYLLFEHRDEIIMIDQHAAHERLIFDGYVEKLNSRSTINRQGMLTPIILRTNSEESQFIDENIAYIREIGFSINKYGDDAYRIDEIPADFDQLDVNGFFDDILKDVQSLKVIRLQDIMKDKLAMAACKHAIKGGHRLTKDEIRKLLKMINGNFGLKCPHGRPVCVKLTKTQIEKMFKRIV